MKTLMLVSASALALSLGGAAQAGQSGSANPTMPRAATQNQANLSRDEVRQVQEKLQSQGLYKGQVDGVDGRKTRQAIEAFQKKNGLQTNGALDSQTLSKLGISATTASGSSTAPGSSAAMQPSAGTSGSYK
jgi:peptidoglycan hydrolase-like protein with peptidoglycan-binding domain